MISRLVLTKSNEKIERRISKIQKAEQSRVTLYIRGHINSKIEEALSKRVIPPVLSTVAKHDVSMAVGSGIHVTKF
jgi:hypothetical protein